MVDVLDDPGRRRSSSSYFAAELLLSGRLVPLPLHARLGAARWPTSCRSSGRSAFPIEALVGDLPPAELLGGLVMQALWIAIGAIARRASSGGSRSGATRAVGG